MRNIHRLGAEPCVQLCVAAALLLVFLIPAPALAQQSSSGGVARRFAVGGGAVYGAAICYDCDEPGTPGASVGFEVRINEDWSFVTEGVWTAAYEVRSITREGVTYPTFRHDYFAFLELKARWEFSDMRHRPYLTFGFAVSWDHDTTHNYWGGSDGWHEFSLDDVRVDEELTRGGGLLFGFGWSFKVSDRIDIRPEAGFVIGKPSFARVGVSGWFNF